MQSREAQKQMGPAFLPTPLLPARGRCGCAPRPANLPICSPLSALGARLVPRPAAFLPVFPLRFRPLLRRLASRTVTGARTGIRHCFVTAFPSSSRSSLPGRSAPSQGRDHRYLSGQRVKHCMSALESTFLQLSLASIAALTVTSLHSCLKQVGLRPVETFFIPPLSESVDSRHCIYET